MKEALPVASLNGYYRLCDIPFTLGIFMLTPESAHQNLPLNNWLKTLFYGINTLKEE